MVFLHIILRAVLGAVLFRGRSGIFNHLACRLAGRDSRHTKLIGDVEARVIYALLMVTLQFDRMSLPELGLVAAAFFLGTLWPEGLERRLDSGQVWRHFGLLVVRGLWFTAPTGVVLWSIGYAWWFGAVGVLWAICYTAAQYIPSRIPQLRQGRELGEATFGGAQGLAFALI